MGAGRSSRTSTSSLGAGGNIGILGRNGAGKSTLIRLIAAPSGRPRAGSDAACACPGRSPSGEHSTPPDRARQPEVRRAAFTASTTGPDRFVEDFTELGESSRTGHALSAGMSARLAFALSMAIEFDCFLIDEALVVGDARFHARCPSSCSSSAGTRVHPRQPQRRSVKDHCENAVVLHEGQLLPFPSRCRLRVLREHTDHSAPAWRTLADDRLCANGKAACPCPAYEYLLTCAPPWEPSGVPDPPALPGPVPYRSHYGRGAASITLISSHRGSATQPATIPARLHRTGRSTRWAALSYRSISRSIH